MLFFLFLTRRQSFLSVTESNYLERGLNARKKNLIIYPRLVKTLEFFSAIAPRSKYFSTFLLKP